MVFKKVLSTREGMLGMSTAIGLKISSKSVFVALPSDQALWKIVIVRWKDKQILAPVLDVGPWNERDDRYVFGLDRPLSEIGQGTYRAPTNHSGIDLSDGIISFFGVPVGEWGVRQVEWAFVAAHDLILGIKS